MVIIRRDAFISKFQANTMDERIILLGFALVFVGMVVMIIGSALGTKGKSGSGFAVGGFIGPIPFGWATDKPLLYAVIAISVVMFLLFMAVGRLNF